MSTIEHYTNRLANLLAASNTAARSDALRALAGEVSRIAWNGPAQAEAQRIVKVARAEAASE